jgi:hypothetical protein
MGVLYMCVVFAGCERKNPFAPELEDPKEPPIAVPDTLRFNIPDVANFFEVFPTIDSKSNILTNHVIVNMASMSFSGEQLGPLVSQLRQLRDKSNVEVNNTDYYAAEEKVRYSFDQFLDKGQPNLRANPHRLLVEDPEDYQKFIDAGRRDAVRRHFHFGNVARFLDGYQEVVETANENPEGDFSVGFATCPWSQQQERSSPMDSAEYWPLGGGVLHFEADQLDPFTDGIHNLRQLDNVRIFWSSIYLRPRTAGINYSFDDHYARKHDIDLENTNKNIRLSRGPGGARWVVTEEDYPRFIEARPGNANAIVQQHIEGETLTLVITSPFNLGQRMPEIRTHLNSHPDNDVLATMNNMSFGPTEIDSLAAQVGWMRTNPRVNITQNSYWPTAANIDYTHALFVQKGGTANPPAFTLAMHPQNQYRLRIASAQYPQFRAAGQDGVLEFLYPNFTSTAALLNNNGGLPEINARSNESGGRFIVNVNSIGVAQAQLTPLTNGVGGLGQNVTLNWTNIYPTEQGILITYQNNWVLLRRPTLAATPHLWAVNGADFTNFNAQGQNSAIRARFAAADLQNLTSQIPTINNVAGAAANAPDVNVQPLGLNATQLGQLVTAITGLHQNTNLNWTNIHPTSAGIRLGFQNWAAMRKPMLVGQPHLWDVNGAEFMQFHGDNQNGAIRAQFDTTSLQNLISHIATINQVAAVAANQPVVNVPALGLSGTQLAELVTAITGMNQNTDLKWTNIHPAAAGILLSYHNQWVPLRQPSLALGAGQHRWDVSAEDHPLFVAAGFGNFVQIPVVPPHSINITNINDLMSKLYNGYILGASGQHDNVVVNVPSVGITRQTQLDSLAVGVNNIIGRPQNNVSMNWTDIWSGSTRILLRHGNHWILLGQPPLRSNPDRWTVPTAQQNLFTGQANNVRSHLPSVDYHCDWHPNGALLPHITADEIVWNKHLANARNLEYVIDWGWHVNFVQTAGPGLPGWQKALGNVTNRILQNLHTPQVPSNGNLRATHRVIVTSFSPTGAFNPNVSACFHDSNSPSTCCNHPAAPMEIDHLGDMTGNWAFQHLQSSMGAVGHQGITPHVTSTGTGVHANRIYFEPNRHYPDLLIPQLPHLPVDPLRSRYRMIWFAENSFVFKLGAQNNVTVVIEMSKLTLCGPGLAPYSPDEWAEVAYFLMQTLFGSSPEIYNVDLPTPQQVKADVSIQNAR